MPSKNSGLAKTGTYSSRSACLILDMASSLDCSNHSPVSFSFLRNLPISLIESKISLANAVFSRLLLLSWQDSLFSRIFSQYLYNTSKFVRYGRRINTTTHESQFLTQHCPDDYQSLPRGQPRRHIRLANHQCKLLFQCSFPKCTQVLQKVRHLVGVFGF